MDRTIIYTAQTREMARRRIIEELELKSLARSQLLRPLQGAPERRLRTGPVR